MWWASVKRKGMHMKEDWNGFVQKKVPWGRNFEEGERKGREEGIKKVAINMLLKKLDEKIVSESTGLSVQEIQKLKNNG
jgi:predicted transposase/invertase (TIGR01784 family)